jgi:hypothetical protein
VKDVHTDVDDTAPRQESPHSYPAAQQRKSPSSLLPWYQLSVPKVTALKYLQNTPEGTFVVRNSESRPNWYF